ncbi:MAG: hypothetical protein ACMUIU_09120 [bacterium]
MDKTIHALSSLKDQYHEKAVEIADQLEAEGARIITKRAIVIGIANAMAKLSYRTSAIELLDSIEVDPILFSVFTHSLLTSYFPFYLFVPPSYLFQS